VVVDAGYAGTGPLGVATAEVQTVTITSLPTGGNFQLTYDGETTFALGYNSTAGDVENALEALPNLAPGDVTVSGGPGPGTPYVVTFAVSLGDVPQMTATDDFTGGIDPEVEITTTTPYVPAAPAAGDWMYATGPVVVRLSDVEVLPDLVWLNNAQQVIAERLIAASFDPCTLRAVELVVPTPAP
jgi:hypothetical protein